MGNKTVQDVVPVVLPDNTTAVATEVNGTAASASPTIGASRKLPSLLPKVWSRGASADSKNLKAIRVRTGPQYWESGREILDANTIPYNDMNLAKLCPSPAYLGAPASAYPIDSNAPTVPGQESDLHDGMRTWDVLSLTGTRTAKSIIKRLLNGAFQQGRTKTERAKYQQERIEQGESLRKIFKDDAREFLRTHVLGRSINPWGAPMKKAFVTPAPETMMYGHLQTVSAGCEASSLRPSFSSQFHFVLVFIAQFALLLSRLNANNHTGTSEYHSSHPRSSHNPLSNLREDLRLPSPLDPGGFSTPVMAYQFLCA